MIISTRTGAAFQSVKSLSGGLDPCRTDHEGNPGHREGQAIFVAALRHEVEEVVGADREFTPAPEGRIGVEDVIAPHETAGATV